jgi:hypothetical protein
VTVVTSQTPLPVLEITSPCAADWNAMPGDAARRFCDQCGKHVHNLSAMPSEAALNVVQNATGRTCVRFERDENGQVMTLDYERPPKPRRRFRRVMLAAVTLFGPRPRRSSATLLVAPPSFVAAAGAW